MARLFLWVWWFLNFGAIAPECSCANHARSSNSAVAAFSPGKAPCSPGKTRFLSSHGAILATRMLATENIDTDTLGHCGVQQLHDFVIAVVYCPKRCEMCQRAVRALFGASRPQNKQNEHCEGTA